MRFYLDITDDKCVEEYKRVKENLSQAQNCYFSLKQLVVYKGENGKTQKQGSLDILSFPFKADLKILTDCSDDFSFLSVLIKFEDNAQALQALNLWEVKCKRGQQRLEKGQTDEERENDYFIEIAMINMDLKNEKMYVLSVVKPLALSLVNETDNEVECRVRTENIAFGAENATIEQIDYISENNDL